jgi:shikimate kinase
VHGPIVLVGLMGSGKTTAGKRLASLLDRPFVDADDALEAATGRTIADIFETDGEPAFRELETATLRELLDRPDQPVIASGGGAVTQEGNRRLLKEHPSATVVWLNGSPEFIASRIQAKPHRPLLGGGADARAVLQRLHRERAPLYRDVMDLEVDIQAFHLGGPKAKQALAEHIASLLRESRRARA